MQLSYQKIISPIIVGVVFAVVVILPHFVFAQTSTSTATSTPPTTSTSTTPTSTPPTTPPPPPPPPSTGTTTGTTTPSDIANIASQIGTIQNRIVSALNSADPVFRSQVLTESRTEVGSLITRVLDLLYRSTFNQISSQISAIVSQLSTISSTTPESTRNQMLTNAASQVAQLTQQLQAIAAAAGMGGIPGSGSPGTSTQIYLKLGDTGDKVTALQNILKTNSSLYPEGLVTGYYGALTESAVMRFQTQNGLSATGNIDLATLNRLSATYGSSSVQIIGP